MERSYVLKGEHPKNCPQEQYFTHNEGATAMGIAQDWLRKGWNPVLFSKTYAGDFKFHLDYRKVQSPKVRQPDRKRAA